MATVRVKPGARERMVAGAADMLSRRGLSATSVRELARHAKAPLGSTYHYFPGGKPQLVTEAVKHAGDAVHDALRRELAAGPVAGLRAFLMLWRDIVVESRFRAGCPVLAVAVEEPVGGDPDALAIAAEVFRSWESLLSGSLRQHGVERKRAAEIATLIIAAVEGTVAMCRAGRSSEALDRVSRQLEGIVEDAVGRNPRR